jgi:hydrogenase maturation protease
VVDSSPEQFIKDSLETESPVLPTLVFTWGNPSRGDDAIGPRIYDRLQASAFPGVELLTDFQLQIEHAMDMADRQRILFIDASVSAKDPFEFSRLQPERDTSYTSHALNPSALLSVYHQINHREPPPSYLLKIRGYQFDLGLPLSDTAKSNSDKAHQFVLDLLNIETAMGWDRYCNP